MKKVFLIVNDKIWNSYKNFTSNNDLNNILSCLKFEYEVNLICRKSSKKLIYPISKKFKFCKIANIQDNDINIFMISITPFNFLCLLRLMLLGKKIKGFVYLRSDGYGEYKAILGRIGPLIYHFMFSITGAISNLISCRDYILRGKKGKLINPSQLDSVWLRQPKNIEIRNFKLLYVGRVRVEKGIFALSELIRNKRDISLTIIGAEKGSSNKINQSNIKILPTQINKTKLIKYYDDHNIFVLPSFTEGHPMVLLEALARRRPVVIFDDIKHVIGDKKGIFVTKRNFLSFLGTLNNIRKNYKKIQKDMKKNKLPTNKEFIDKFVKYIDDFN